MTPIGAKSKQRRVVFAGTVDRGWRVALLPTRVGLYVGVTEDGVRSEHTGVAKQCAVALRPDTKGAVR